MNSKPPFTNQSLLDQAEQFRAAYNLVATGKSGRQTQKCLIDEEWSEFHEAYWFESEANQLNELADLVYVCFQYAANMEWDLDEAMRRVHQANMSKLGEDGKPIYRGDGKVLKGPNFKKAVFNDLVK
jgi:predicted HAD superfamily Cof-like phosphohydrolase